MRVERIWKRRKSEGGMIGIYLVQSLGRAVCSLNWPGWYQEGSQRWTDGVYGGKENE